MIREIVPAQVGQCTNLIGKEFWNTMNVEHKLANKDDAENATRFVHFNETGELTFVLRAALVNLELGLDVIKASPMDTMLKRARDDFVFGVDNNCRKEHCTDHEGAELVDEVVESCYCSQGFQITHSLGAGTGSGLEIFLLMKMREKFADRITATFSVYPSPTVIEPYNEALSINDETIEINNEQQQQAKYGELNWLISSVMSSCISA